jgi:hypothetical protein
MKPASHKTKSGIPASADYCPDSESDERDREKCLEAGASEYLAKPMNTEQLLSALRM